MQKGPLALLIIVLVAMNLRPAMAALGPLLDLIEHSTGISSAGAGMLTTLPVFLMGTGAFAGRHLRIWLGDQQGIAVCILLIAIACAARWIWNDAFGLFVTAACAGLGIAIVQAMVPAVVKRRFGAGAGRAMGLYTTGIMGGAALAAATAAGLAQAGGWPFSLAIWSVPAVAALVCWLSYPDAYQSRKAGHAPSTSFYRQRRAWLLLIFFGVGTGAYTLVLAWLPHSTWALA